MDWLPDLERDAHGRDLEWSSTKHPKGVIHTTESSGWPSYDGWTIHPHATVKPIPGKGVEGRQHVPFSRASFSLRNEPGGVQTNTDYAFQFELIGTSEKGGPGYYWPGADDVVLLDLYRKVIAPLSAARSIPLKARPFQAYPASYGPASGTNNVRMPGATWDAYAGWCGHQHVPENVHGDPGAFPWDRMIQLAEEDDMALSSDDKTWLKSAVKATVEEVLKGSEIVPNRPLTEGDPTTYFTPVNAWANVETDQDTERADVRDRLTRIEAALAKLVTPPAGQ